jgi:hypothetical protein
MEATALEAGFGRASEFAQTTRRAVEETTVE